MKKVDEKIGIVLVENVKKVINVKKNIFIVMKKQ
jgi:hypothetical protein